MTALACASSSHGQADDCSAARPLGANANAVAAADADALSVDPELSNPDPPMPVTPTPIFSERCSFYFNQRPFNG